MLFRSIMLQVSQALKKTNRMLAFKATGYVQGCLDAIMQDLGEAVPAILRAVRVSFDK